jgi:hypothetical protein
VTDSRRDPTYRGLVELARETIRRQHNVPPTAWWYEAFHLDGLDDAYTDPETGTFVVPDMGPHVHVYAKWERG